MRPFKRSLLASAVALGLAGSGAASAQFSNAYFFGDSVADSGNLSSKLPPGTGKFTTNPGPVWSEVFAQRFDHPRCVRGQHHPPLSQGNAKRTCEAGFLEQREVATQHGCHHGLSQSELSERTLQPVHVVDIGPVCVLSISLV